MGGVAGHVGGVWEVGWFLRSRSLTVLGGANLVRDWGAMYDVDISSWLSASGFRAHGSSSWVIIEFKIYDSVLMISITHHNCRLTLAKTKLLQAKMCHDSDVYLLSSSSSDGSHVDGKWVSKPYRQQSSCPKTPSKAPNIPLSAFPLLPFPTLIPELSLLLARACRRQPFRTKQVWTGKPE